MIRWIAWNLFLAAIPAILGYILGWAIRKQGKRRNLHVFLCLPIAVAWLAFLPNAPYLISEWRHLLFDQRWKYLLTAAETDHAAMLDVATYALAFLAYSGAGIILFVLAIRPVERAMRANRSAPLLYAPFLFFFVSLGVYLGLIVRLNSWHIITQPREVWNASSSGLLNPNALIPMLVFAVTLWLIYEAVDLWMDGVRERLARMGLVSHTG